MQGWKDDPRAKTNPLFQDNKLKLGLFGLNAGHQIFTRAPDRFQAEWARCDAAVAIADAIGLEVVVSLMGWGQKIELEPFTWAAALLARHTHPAVIATMHVQLMHPAFVAKGAATADIVSNGRFGINLVAGAGPDTFGTFGMTLEDHATRYDHAAEFIELLDRFWSATEPFDFDGRFYNVRGGLSLPKPIQRRPAIMNAGTSDRGRDYACRNADMVFTHIVADKDQARAQIADFKRHARDAFDREVQVWTHGFIVIRETEPEADAFLRHYAVEHADRPRIDAWVKMLFSTAPNMSAEDKWKFDRDWGAGGGVPLVGTADQVAERLIALSDIGLDGILLNSIEPENMLGHLGQGVLPRLEAAGVRRPYRVAASPAPALAG